MYGFTSREMYRFRYGTVLGVMIGFLGGGLVGVVAGFLFVAFPWSLGGAIIGAVLKPRLLGNPRRGAGTVQGIVLGILGGTLIAAFRHDEARATAGALPGAIIGADRRIRAAAGR